MSGRFVLVHADESCLGNQNESPRPGGAGSLIEVCVSDEIVRKDLFICSADTTNNRMALVGAIETLKVLAGKGERLEVAYVSDSKYLVQGMKEWIHGWKRRGWKRKTGEIENLALWKELDAASRLHRVNWIWVRGHAGHAKNEYADRLAVRAAAEQKTSDGPVDSEFQDWLQSERDRGKYSNYDASEDFRKHERAKR